MARPRKDKESVKSWKNLVLALRRKKEAKQKSKLPVFQTEDEYFKRIGSGTDYSTESSYPWSTIQSKYSLDKSDEPLVLRSLKEICAMEIAQNHEMINQELLHSGNWSIWNLVWKYIIRWRRDSFKTFQVFADVFAGEKGFHCHDGLRSYPDSRYRTLMSSTMPHNTNHRIERFYSNLKFNGFIRTITHSRFQNLVILEITKKLHEDDLIQLTNLTNLTALKISNINGKLQDTVINSWCSALKASKWTKLQVLCIPEISQSSMIKLQKQAHHSKLLYVEISSPSNRFNVQKDWPEVDINKWDVVTDRSITERSLGLKFQILMNKYKLPKSILPDSKTILLDFNIVDNEYESQDEVCSKRDYDYLWGLGEVQGNYTGLVLKHIEERPDEKMVTEYKMPSTKKIKKNPKKTSVKSFFDL